MAVRVGNSSESMMEKRYPMALSFEQVLIEVWRQALIDQAKAVELGSERFTVRRTPKRGLHQADFTFGKRDSGAGAEPADEISVGADGTVRQEGDAVPP